MNRYFMDDKLIKAKIALDRGKYWMSYLNFVMILFIATSALKEYPALSFMSSRYWLIVLFVLSFVSLLVLGYIDIKFFGAYQKEIEVMSRINPVQQKMFKNQEEILRRLERIEARMNSAK